MKMTPLTTGALGLCLLAGDVQAQSFLESMARRAVASAAGEALGRAVTGQRPDASSPPAASPSELAAAPTRPSRRSSRTDDAPEAEGLQGLSDDERSQACEKRYPVAGLEGEAYRTRSAQFMRCMGPMYGDGG